MTTWKVTNRLTGEVVHAYEAEEPMAWEGMGFDTCNHTALAPEVSVPPPRRLSKLQFIGRFGDAFDTILAAAKVSIEVEKFVRMLDWATPEADGTSVDLDDPRVTGALAALEAAQLIGVGKAAEILE